MSTDILSPGRRQAIREVATGIISSQVIKGADEEQAKAAATYDILLVMGLLGPDVPHDAKHDDSSRLTRMAVRTLIDSLGA